MILNEYKYKKSAKAQWSWMTKKLRGYVGIMKGRACYTCQSYAVSAAQQDLLPLEVKHIIPVAKGWWSVEDNLQTFCWKWIEEIISIPIIESLFFLVNASFFTKR